MRRFALGIAIIGALTACKRRDRAPVTDAATVTVAVPVPATAPDAVPGTETATAIARAVEWLAAFPADQLRFDAAIGLAALVRISDSPTAQRAYAAARATADRDTDSPLRRAYDDASRVAPTNRWDVPAAGAARVNVNRVVAEALHCDVHPLRPATLAYVTGAMRDGGGYHTAHGLWALVLARDRSCVTAARFATLAAPLVAELRAAQPAVPETVVLAVDLYAERLLMLILAGERDAAIDGWAIALRSIQAPDGGFGLPAPDVNAYHRYHATLAAAWALAVWAER